MELRAPPSTVPVVADTGELTRLDHWRNLSQNVVRRELLEITEWLGQDPDRLVMSQTDEGPRAVRASEANNVVFLVPRMGPERDEWERRLGLLNLAHQTRRKVELALSRARTRREQIERDLAEIDRELKPVRSWALEAEQKRDALHAQATRQLTSLRDRCRRDGSRPGRSEMAEARRLATRYRHWQEAAAGRETTRVRAEEEHRPRRRHLEGELARARAEVTRLEQASAPQVLVGFCAWINTFLDLQALFTAGVASEELRRHPRPNLQKAEELEAALDRDEL